MGRSTVDTSGLDRLIERLNKADELVRAFALQIEAEAKIAINTGQKTGRIYKRGKRVHQASAEGQAPANDRGGLVTSGSSNRVRFAMWMVTFGMKYAAILESKNRPFLSTAVKKIRPVFERAVKRLFEVD